jgi:hypothetical protein
MKLGEQGKLRELGEILAVQLFLPSCTRECKSVEPSLTQVRITLTIER